MVANTEWMDFLLYLGAQIPLFLVIIVGMVLAIIYWRRAPQACLFALLGFTLYLVASILNAMLNYLYPDLLFDAFDAMDLGNDRMLFFYSDLFFALLRGIAFVFIFIGVYSGRGQPGAPPPRVQ